jgi:hypothetical protein
MIIFPRKANKFKTENAFLKKDIISQAVHAKNNENIHVSIENEDKNRSDTYNDEIIQNTIPHGETEHGDAVVTGNPNLSSLGMKVKSSKNKLKFLTGLKNFKPFVERHLILSMSMVNLKDVDEEGRNIIHRTCLQLKWDIIKSLKEKLTIESVNKVDNYGNTPLLLACKMAAKNEDDTYARNMILKTLIESKADVNVIEPEVGWGALHWLCFNGDEHSVKILIDSGAIYFAPDKNGFFPIDLAGKKGNRKIVNDLVEEFEQFLDTIGEFQELDPNVITLGRSFGLISKRSTINDGRNDVKINSFALDEKNLLNRRSSGCKNIKVNLELINPFLQTLFVRIIINHCLYWVSMFKLNNRYINKFILEYGARPNVSYIPIYGNVLVQALFLK